MRRGFAALLSVAVLAPDAGAQEAKAPAASVLWVGADGGVLDVSNGLSLARTPPPTGDTDDEGLSVVVVTAEGAPLPASIAITTVRAPENGPARPPLDLIESRALAPMACPAAIGAGKKCAKTEPFRLVIDEIDRRHPLLSSRSIFAELGGAITITGDGVEPATVRIDAAAGRTRARLRVRLVRLVAKGPTPVGRDTDDALRLAREELERASAVWSPCGVSFGPPADADVTVVDPPPSFLLAVGCDAPVYASGGELRFAVDGKELSVAVPAGATPREAARMVDAAVRRAGFKPTVSDNAPSHASSLGSSDVLVSRSNGTLATLTMPKRGAVSTDATLDACIGRVALEDGLQHFTDADAVAGTLEERTLVKAFDDGDPSTIEVFVVPSFGQDARIGESFIFLEQGAIRNAVLEDRAGFRAQRASFTLAHEIGHVILDQPGHPDDFNGDTPTSLMDADAVNPTAFGPRRLSAAECKRARTQSSAAGPSPILAPWPLAPLEPAAKKAKSTAPR